MHYTTKIFFGVNHYAPLSQIDNYLLDEIGFMGQLCMKLWCDNQVTIHIALDPEYYEKRIEHIKVNCHFIQEELEKNEEFIMIEKYKHKRIRNP